MRKLITPDAAVAEATRCFDRAHLDWWRSSNAGVDAARPVTITLGVPNADEAAGALAEVRIWIEAWHRWPGPGHVDWVERRWPVLGSQRLPARLILANPDQVAELAGHASRWQRARFRKERLAAMLPAGTAAVRGARVFGALADWTDADFERLISLLAWLREHPRSGLLLRQLPVAGLDSKWIEQRRGAVTEIVDTLPWNSDAASRDLHDLLGLGREAPRVRLRILCPTLRRRLDGLADVQAPIVEIAMLGLEPDEVWVIENLTTALALPDRPGTVALAQLGYAVGLLADVPWLRDRPLRYWGDIDTHGLVMLARLRAVLPRARSMLMDRGTLIAHRELCVEEPSPWLGPIPSALDEEERLLFEALVAHVWGPRLRLEQERIP